MLDRIFDDIAVAVVWEYVEVRCSFGGCNRAGEELVSVAHSDGSRRMYGVCRGHGQQVRARTDDRRVVRQSVFVF